MRQCLGLLVLVKQDACDEGAKEDGNWKAEVCLSTPCYIVLASAVCAPGIDSRLEGETPNK